MTSRDPVTILNDDDGKHDPMLAPGSSTNTSSLTPWQQPQSTPQQTGAHYVEFRTGRGRNVRGARLNCNDIPSMEARFRAFVSEQEARGIDERTVELHFDPDSIFTVRESDLVDAADGNRAILQYTMTADGHPTPSGDVIMSMEQALHDFPDPKDTVRRQRVIARRVMQAIEAVDGYRYQFHNTWKSVADPAYRFSWYCNDSTLNKDRVATGRSRNKGKDTTRARAKPLKAVYECKGTIATKFDGSLGKMVVVYRHRCIHPKHEELQAEYPGPSGKTPAQRTREYRQRKAAERQTESGHLYSVPAVPEQSLSSLLMSIRDGAATNPSQPPTRSASSSYFVPLTHYEIPGGSSPLAEPIQARSRGQALGSGKACLRCRDKRTKCDGVHPKCGLCVTRKAQCEYATTQPDAIDESAALGAPAAAGVQPGRSNDTADNRTEQMARELEKTKADYATLEKQQEELKSAMAKQQQEMMARLDALEVLNKSLQDELGNLQAGSQLEVPASATTTNRRSVSKPSGTPAIQYEFSSTAGAGEYRNMYNTSATSGQYSLSTPYQQPYYTASQAQQQTGGAASASTTNRGFPAFPYSNTSSSSGFWNQGR